MNQEPIKLLSWADIICPECTGLNVLLINAGSFVAFCASVIVLAFIADLVVERLEAK